MDVELAECVGLWLAEGDSKSRYELTFTNNEPYLIRHFYSCILKLFPNRHFRLYIYGLGDAVKPPITVLTIKNYIDIRARKPYFIVRLASKEAMGIWRDIVDKYLRSNNIVIVASILRGFFAGEGSVKVSSHNSYLLRIVQKERIDFVERWFSVLSLRFRFFKQNRTYEFSGRANWEVFARYELADLHPVKKKLFWDTYNSFKQYHYPTFYLKKNILSLLSEPKTNRQLAKIFSRSSARVYDILSELKKRGVIYNFRVGSVDYWVTGNVIIISKKKKAYLNYISVPRLTSNCASFFKVTFKSAAKRLEELEKLGLAERLPTKQWKAINTEKKLFVV